MASTGNLMLSLLNFHCPGKTVTSGTGCLKKVFVAVVKRCLMRNDKTQNLVTYLPKININRHLIKKCA